MCLQVPHKSPSVVISRTRRSISAMSVSSSHGFTSRMMLDLAIKAGSVKEHCYNVVNNSKCRKLTLGFLGSVGGHTLGLDALGFLIFIVRAEQVDVIIIILIISLGWGSSWSWSCRFGWLCSLGSFKRLYP